MSADVPPLANPAKPSADSAASARPAYLRVLATFLRNALVREMTFRSNFLITVVTRGFWFVAQLALFEIIYGNVRAINDWSRPEYFGFMATAMLVNSLVETFFMPNCANFSEMIRTGNLDFVLLKPVDPQFLVSFEKVELANLTQGALACGLLGYSVSQLDLTLSVGGVLLYAVLVLSAVAFFYSLMIALAATSVWLGRNQGLYDFWFYITVFARYPRSIYAGTAAGDAIRYAFTYLVPILLVTSIPARELLSKPITEPWLVALVPVAGLLGLFVSRKVFLWSLTKYRSASS